MPDATTSPLSSLHGIPRRLYALAALGLAGTGVSIYLTQHYYEVRNGSAGFQSFCNLGQSMNCDVVAASTYAELFPGMPLSSVAAGWFFALFVLALLARNAFWRRDAVRGIVLVSAVAGIMSLVYLGIMIWVLKTYCLFCLITDGIALLSLALGLSLKPEPLSKTKPDRAKWRTMGMVTAISVAVSLIGLRVLDASQLTRSQIQDSVRSVLSSPVLPLNTSPELPSMGPADARITIVEFSDFQCPYCRIGAYSLNSVMTHYPKDVRVVFRSFPLDQACNRKVERMMHAHACEAAKASICAHKQGKFVPVYEALFEKQEAITAGTTGVALKIAQDAGANADELNGCINSPETALAITRDIEEGINLGVQSTPTFFINGHRVEGGKPPEVWGKIIDELLKTPAQ